MVEKRLKQVLFILALAMFAAQAAQGSDCLPVGTQLERGEYYKVDESDRGCILIARPAASESYDWIWWANSVALALVVALFCVSLAGKHAIDGNVAMTIFNLFLAFINFAVVGLNLWSRE